MVTRLSYLGFPVGIQLSLLACGFVCTFVMSVDMFDDFSFSSSRHQNYYYSSRMTDNISPTSSRSPSPPRRSRPPTHISVSELSDCLNRHSIEPHKTPRYRESSSSLRSSSKPPLPRTHSNGVRQHRSRATRRQCSSSHLHQMASLAEQLLQKQDQPYSSPPSYSANTISAYPFPNMMESIPQSSSSPYLDSISTSSTTSSAENSESDPLISFTKYGSQLARDARSPGSVDPRSKTRTVVEKNIRMRKKAVRK